MTVRSGISSNTPDRIIIDAGAVYLNYDLANERVLGATRGGNEFNLNRVTKNIEADGLKGAVKGMKRVTEVNPQITANLLELSVENLIASIAGAVQTDLGYIELEHIDGAAKTEFDLNQNDVVRNSEVVYAKDADGEVTTLVKQTRSKKYASRFVGAERDNNKEFETGIGDWTKATDQDAPVSASDGQVGKCMKFTGKLSAAITNFLNLPGTSGDVLTDLVPGEHYRLQIAVKKDADSWDEPGDVTVACDAGSIAITLTADWEVFVITFIASAADATISLTVATTAPVATNIIYIDHLELERVDYPTEGQRDLGQIGYVMNWGDNINGKASVIFMVALTGDDEIAVSYTYEKETSGTHTTVTGGEIADTDYIDNVAIVGNVSGKTYPVICIVKNALADAGFSLATAPRDEAVPSIVFTGHYDPDFLDIEPWEIRWPKS